MIRRADVAFLGLASPVLIVADIMGDVP